MKCFRWESSLFLLVAVIFSACAPLMPTTTESPGATEVDAASIGGDGDTVRRVLLIPREGSIDLEYMITHELQVMKSMLEDAGFEVVVATD